MALFFFGLVVYTVILAINGAFKSKEERAKLVSDFKQNPAGNIFAMVWVSAAIMFFFGIFIPVLGEKAFFDTGLKIWQVGGLGFFWGVGCHLVCKTVMESRKYDKRQSSDCVCLRSLLEKVKTHHPLKKSNDFNEEWWAILESNQA